MIIKSLILIIFYLKDNLIKFNEFSIKFQFIKKNRLIIKFKNNILAALFQ